jgi:hypothetical protein
MEQITDRLKRDIDATRALDLVAQPERLASSPKKTSVRQFASADWRASVFQFHRKARIDNPLFKARAGTSISYADLCKLLRAYIIDRQLVQPSGRISCDHLIKALTGLDEASFFEIAKRFTSIVL